MMGLAEKIGFEYQCFFLDCMRTSREYIFAHSGEIEMKKQLKEGLLSLVPTLDEDTRQLLSVQEPVLDAAYRFWMDESSRNTDSGCGQMKGLLLRWIVQMQA